MVLDTKLAGILSNFCLDLAKAYFVATFITPGLSGEFNLPEIVLVLTRGVLVVTILIFLSWKLEKLKKYHESN